MKTPNSGLTETINGEPNANGPKSLPSFGNQLRRSASRFKDKPITFLLLGSTAALLLFALSDIFLPLVYGPERGGFTPIDLAYRLVISLLLVGLVALPMTALGFGAAYKISGVNAIKHGLQKALLALMTGAVAFFTALLPMLLIIPGLIMGSRFSLLLPVVVVEGKVGFEALTRSWNLAHGYTKGVMRNILLILGAMGLSLAVTGMTVGLFGWPMFVALAVLLPFSQILLQVTYEDLNRLKGAAVPIENGYGVYQKLAVLGLILAIGVFAAGSLNIFKKDNTSNTSNTSNKVAQNQPTHTVQTSNTDKTIAKKPQVTKSGKDRDWQRYQDITALRLALNSHFNDTGRYPTNLNELVPKYIKELPVDPVSGSLYQYARDEGSFSLGFSLEEGVAQLNAGGHSLTPSGFDTSNKVEAAKKLAKSISDSDSTTTPTPPASSTTTTSGGSSGSNTYNIYNTYTSGSDDGTDTDNDGLSDEQERSVGTNPLTADTDGDGIIDSDETAVFGTDPTNPDTDGDSLTDAEEIAAGTDPNVPDTVVNPPSGTTTGGTSGGTTGGTAGGDTSLVDTDNDGLADTYELNIGTDPNNPDTDGDGLADGDEIMIYGSNPLSADTDLDGVSDADEILAGTNPLLPPSGSSGGGTSGGGTSSGGTSGGGAGGGGGYIPPQVIEQRIALFGLHEPTLSTLGFWHPAWPGL